MELLNLMDLPVPTGRERYGCRVELFRLLLCAELRFGTKCKLSHYIILDPNGNAGLPYWMGSRQHCGSCPFEWNDHSPFDYTNWEPGEPNNAGNGEDCVEYYPWDKMWNDDDCNKEFPFVCQAYIEGKYSC